MNKERAPLSVVSTYALDRLIQESTMEVIKEQKGGPILYILGALHSLGIDTVVFSGEEMLVEILVRDDDEFGRIPPPPEKKPLPEIKTPNAIVSTLLDEWDLSQASDYHGKLFVDIQGYVRDGSAFGRKKSWDGIETIAPFIFCLKGNDVEIGMLPSNVVEDQMKNRMIITTKDSKGVDIIYKGEKFSFTPTEELHPPHTIGAGDTWFANFVAKFIETSDVSISAEFAMAQTSAFLKNIT